MPSLGAATRVWFKIGCLSFGGPAGQVALMHREVVESRHWIGEQRFLNAFNFCALLPGPEAQQLATYLGWLLHGAKGGFIAGLLFVLPGTLLMLGLSVLFLRLGDLPAVGALFFGLMCAVLEALLKVARRALKSASAWSVALFAFAALFFFALPFPLVLLAAALIGALAARHFAPTPEARTQESAPALLDALLEAEPARAKDLAESARRAGVGALVAWLAPLALLLLSGGLYADIAWFFSKMAVVTFGGAYAVLAYVAQEAVEGYAWLSASQMLTGLGLAETTPGPLILVLQFVGFLAGAQGGDLLGGFSAALLTLWVTFAPCFAFVFLGAPAIERLQSNEALAGALAGITAAVVGVIANLALWFGLRVLFDEQRPLDWGPVSSDLPVPASLDPAAVTIVVLAAFALFRFRLGLLATLGLCAGAGLMLKVAAGL